MLTLFFDHLPRAPILSFEEYVSSSEFYIELCIVLGCLLLARAVAALLQRSPVLVPAEAGLDGIKVHARQSSPLATFLIPTFLFVFLGLSTLVAHHAFTHIQVLVAATHLSIVAILVKMLRELTSNRTWLALMACAMVCVVFVNFLGFLEPVLPYLDSFGITIGQFHVSIVKLVNVFLMLAVLVWVTRTLSSIAERYVRAQLHLEVSTREWLVKLFEIILYFIAALILIDYTGVDLTTLAVFSGAVGVGIGIGLQKIASNFISGFILLFEKIVEVGDVVELDGGIYGHIRRLDARGTLIETYDGREIIVPNEEFITKQVTNWTYSNNRARVEIPVGVSYSSDLDQVKKILLESALGFPFVLRDPGPAVYLIKFGESSIDFVLHFWIEDITQGRYHPQSEVMFAIWHKFKAMGIEIPFPQQEIVIRQIDNKPLKI